MFKLTIDDPNLLKNSVSTIAELIDEGTFKVTKDAISFIASDRAMVAVVDFKLLATAFKEYDVKDEPSLAVNMLNLVSILRRANADDKITLINEEGENKLKIIFKGSSLRKFELPLLDISESELPPINKLNFNAEVELNSSTLEQGIQDAEIVSDSVIFEITKDMFKLSGEGDSSKTELSLEKDSPLLSKLNIKGSVKSRYPIDYLKKMIKGAKIADKVILKMSADYPMRMEFSIINKLQLGFVLAPRVSEENY